MLNINAFLACYERELPSAILKSKIKKAEHRFFFFNSPHLRETGKVEEIR